MGGRKKKNRRVLHIGVLILGAYMLFLGGGTLLVNLTALRLGEQDGIVIARALFGAVLTGLGVFAVWDSIRDLFRKKEEDAPPLQFILTDTAGAASSIVTPERLHEQFGLVSEETRPITLQLVTPLPAAELGELINMAYVHMEDGWSLIAVCRQGGGVQVRRKSAGADEAESVLLDLTAGRLPDLSAWERLEAVPRQRDQRDFQFKKRLILYRDNGTSDHEFFTERDLDLAVTGLTDGTYQKVYVQIGTAAIEATGKDGGNIHLRLSILGHSGSRVWQRDGMPNQARFWLLQFCDGSLFQPLSEDWQIMDS